MPDSKLNMLIFIFGAGHQWFFFNFFLAAFNGFKNIFNLFAVFFLFSIFEQAGWLMS